MSYVCAYFSYDIPDSPDTRTFNIFGRNVTLKNNRENLKNFDLNSGTGEARYHMQIYNCLLAGLQTLTFCFINSNANAITVREPEQRLFSKMLLQMA